MVGTAIVAPSAGAPAKKRDAKAHEKKVATEKKDEKRHAVAAKSSAPAAAKKVEKPTPATRRSQSKSPEKKPTAEKASEKKSNCLGEVGLEIASEGQARRPCQEDEGYREEEGRKEA